MDMYKLKTSAMAIANNDKEVAMKIVDGVLAAIGAKLAVEHTTKKEDCVTGSWQYEVIRRRQLPSEPGECDGVKIQCFERSIEVRQSVDGAYCWIEEITDYHGNPSDRTITEVIKIPRDLSTSERCAFIEGVIAVATSRHEE